MKKVFLKQEKDEIAEWDGNLFQAGKDFCPNSGDEKMKS